MKTHVKKWGNSLAVRIPGSFAREAGLIEDAAIDLTIKNGTLIIQPLVREPTSLEELLKGVTDENLHGEWETGPAVGKEIW